MRKVCAAIGQARGVAATSARIAWVRDARSIVTTTVAGSSRSRGGTEVQTDSAPDAASPAVTASQATSTPTTPIASRRR